MFNKKGQKYMKRENNKEKIKKKIKNVQKIS